MFSLWFCLAVFFVWAGLYLYLQSVGRASGSCWGNRRTGSGVCLWSSSRLAQASSYADWDSKVASPTAQVLFKPLLISCLLMLHWPSKVHRQSQIQMVVRQTPGLEGRSSILKACAYRDGKNLWSLFAFYLFWNFLKN